MKTCSKCFVEKSFAFFRVRKASKDGFNGVCNSCKKEQDTLYRTINNRAEQKFSYYRANKQKAKDRAFRNRYGISPDVKCELRDKQNGKCAICGKAEEELGRSLDYDHCHKTGRGRGLLCTSCNTGIGKFRDDPQLLLKAIEYLRNG